MEDNIQIALEERNKYVDKCKEVLIKEIEVLFRTIPLASLILFYMDLPNINMNYRDNPVISDLSLYTSQGTLINNEDSNQALGNLNLLMHLCGIGLIHLFPCGKVMLHREHYIR